MNIFWEADTGQIAVILRERRTLTQQEVDELAAAHDREDLTADERWDQLLGEH